MASLSAGVVAAHGGTRTITDAADGGARVEISEIDVALVWPSDRSVASVQSRGSFKPV